MKFRFAVSAALIATFAAASGASAQGVYSQGGSWMSGWTPGSQVDEFWNQHSDDGTNCNIGFFVQGNFGPCGNEHPAAFPASLGWTNATYLSTTPATALTRTVVLFRPGTYTLAFLGQIAGASPSRLVGVSSFDGSGEVNHTFGTAPETFSFYATKDWEFNLQSFRPAGAGTFYSNDAATRQFTVFANSNGADGQFANDWLVGAEDNSCTVVSQACPGLADYDFNDALVRVTATPEPSSYALMATGLLVIGGAMRRRRAAVVNA
ncbi:MAG: PEP-CTERM sorting domain-containing protein [Gemmatimonadaceae bacterium]